MSKLNLLGDYLSLFIYIFNFMKVRASIKLMCHGCRFVTKANKKLYVYCK